MSLNRKKALVPFLLLVAIVILSLVFPSVVKHNPAITGISAADTAKG